MAKKENRIRIGRRMAAWSDGRRVNVVPCEWCKVDDYGRTLLNLHRQMREGDEYYYGTCSLLRDECRCREYEADRYWERGRHLDALNQMLYAAAMLLPDESVDLMFEDAQWLDPRETLYWHPNVREFLRLMRRCEAYCRQVPRLRPLLESEWLYRSYRDYLRDLGRWVHE